MSDKANGFTIVEIVIIVTVMGLLAGIVMSTLGDFYTANNASLRQTNQDTDTRSSLRQIEEDLSNTLSFTPSRTGLTAPYGANNGTSWNHTGTSAQKRVLIAYKYATTANSSDDTRKPVRVNTGSGCPTTGPTPDTTAKVMLVYFIAADPTSTPAKPVENLYRRTIVNPDNYAYCSGDTPIQKSTCATTNVTCTLKDALIVRDVTKFDVQYYATADPTSLIADPYGSTGSAAVSSAKSVIATVGTKRLIDGKTVTQEANIRITKPF